MKLNIKKPTGWRTGQTIFNFLEWLQSKGYGTTQSGRMSDPFHIPDEKLEEYYAEFLKQHK